MTLTDAVTGWATVTPAQAMRLIGPANSREQAAARKWDASGDAADETAWNAAFALWENLTVLALCGERARNPLCMENG